MLFGSFSMSVIECGKQTFMANTHEKKHVKNVAKLSERKQNLLLHIKLLNCHEKCGPKNARKKKWHTFASSVTLPKIYKTET